MRPVAISVVAERLLALAHQCMSRALHLDYLSNRSVSRQSTPARALRAAIPARTGTAAHSRDIVRQYLGEVATHKRLSSSEEYYLAIRARAEDEHARRQLIERHLGLVVMLARPYRNRGLPLADLIAEGNLGLLRAVEKFDPERGYRLSTYAKWWIRQSIDLALMRQADTVRVPVHVLRALKQQSRARARAIAEPTASFARRPPPALPPGSTQFLLHDARHHTDASHSAQHEETHSLVDLLAAPEHEQPDWPLHLASRRRHLEAAMMQLRDTERLVLQTRFGFVDDTDHTLQSIAQQLNLSCERVRQIQEEALDKLRHVLQSGPDLDHEDVL
jgi:RNA polymerase sigma factor (sigma-70 family)